MAFRRDEPTVSGFNKGQRCDILINHEVNWSSVFIYQTQELNPEFFFSVTADLRVHCTGCSHSAALYLPDLEGKRFSYESMCEIEEVIWLI